MIPPGGSIPLHDHPHMCVLSKVLYGSVNVWSCDWLGDAMQGRIGKVQGGNARVVDNNVVYTENSGIKVLFPNSGGNVHEFTCSDNSNNSDTRYVNDSGVGCAILDVIIPPYDANDDRDCTYYSRTVLQSNENTGKSGNIVALNPQNDVDFTVDQLN